MNIRFIDSLLDFELSKNGGGAFGLLIEGQMQ